MNHLAHLFLSGPDPASRIGNFAADYFKGSLRRYQGEMREAIRLHRSVDAFTDRHPLVIRSKRRLGGRYGHYAGIVIDLIYDHLLARNWSLYSSQTLEAFAAENYAMLQRDRDDLPDPLRSVIDRMIADDWLVSYRGVEGIRRSLSYLSRRIGRGVELSTAVEILQESYQDLDADFLEFFPQLIEHAAGVRGETGTR